METDLQITLLPAPDDPFHLTPAYQQELRSFEQAFRDRGLTIDGYTGNQWVRLGD
jgi:hypothetical protein